MGDTGRVGLDHASLTSLAAFGDATRRRMFELIRHERRPMTREEVADGLGISRKLAAFHLDKLVAAGLLQARYEPPTGIRKVGRRPKVYEPTGEAIAVSIPQRRYGMLADVLTEAVLTETDDESARDAALRVAYARGEALGGAERQRVRPGRLGAERGLGMAADTLEEFGFEPERTTPTLLRRTVCRPMGLGRSGARVAKTPVSGRSVSPRGRTLSVSRSARSSQVSSSTSVPGASPSRARAYRSSKTSQASGAPSSGCRGAAARSVNGDSTCPIGRRVYAASSLSPLRAERTQGTAATCPPLDMPTRCPASSAHSIPSTDPHVGLVAAVGRSVPSTPAASTAISTTTRAQHRNGQVRLSYSSWRRHQKPVSLRPSGARSSHWYMPHRASRPRAYAE